MSSLLQDFRYVLRALTNRPLYALVTIIVLAIAIGANTTVFSVFNGLFLRAMPYENADRLVSVYNTYPNMNLEFAGTSIPDYLDRRAQAPSLEDLAMYTGGSRTLGGVSEPERVFVLRATPSLFGVLGRTPVLGRAFGDAEAVPGSDRVAVLNHVLWQTRFGGRADIVGSDVELDGERYRVLGVMPEGFGFPSRNVDVWVPFAFTPEQMSDEERGREFSSSIGRLRPGATIAGLNAELHAIVRRNIERVPADFASFLETSGFTGRAVPLRDQLVGTLKPMLLVLQGVVAVVLLIACANVANLQLARMAGRRKELSVRAALGASRRRLGRLVLVESLMLALVGGAIGLVLSVGGIALVRGLGLDHSNQGFEFALDARVLTFTLGAMLVAAFVAGLLPLVSALREDLVRGVHEAGRLGSGGRTAQRFRGALVVVQVALSLALLVGAGLLTKSFNRLAAEGPGFEIESIWTAQFNLPRNGYGSDESLAQFHTRVLEEVHALPGVTSAALTSTLPFSDDNWTASAEVEGLVLAEGVAPPHANQRVITEAYLPTLGIPVVAGRNFTANEPEPVAIVDENMASVYWPDGNVLGQRVRIQFGPDEPWHRIIGVVPAVKQGSLAEDATKETIYWHGGQHAGPLRGAALVVRTTLPPDRLTRMVTDAVHRVDPGLPLFDVQPLELRVHESLAPQRMPMVLTLVFAGGAFVLAVVGIYGVLTWAVSQRFGEIGVRMALGAQARDILRLVLSQGGRLIIVGLVLGLAGAVVLGRLIASQIHEVSALDPGVFAIAVAGLATAALLASWLPARRAARIDPMHALREE